MAVPASSSALSMRLDLRFITPAMLSQTGTGRVGAFPAIRETLFLARHVSKEE